MKRKIILPIYRLKHTTRGIFSLLNKFRLAVFLISLFLAVYFLPVKLPLHLPINLDFQISSQLLSAVISALSSILAIALAIIFIAFEIMYKTFHTYVKKAFWEEEKFRELSVIYISTIVFGVISLASLDNSIRSFNLITLLLFLFILCILVLFPYTKALIIGVISTGDIKKLINSLEKRHRDYLSRRVTSPEILSSYIEDRENDPLFILGEASLNYLRDDNTIRVYLIVVEVTKKLISEAEKTSNFRELIKEYIPFYRKIYRQALKSDNEGILAVVLDMIDEIHKFCAHNQKRWHEMIELNEMLEDIISRCIRERLEDVSRDALYMIPLIFEDHLKNNSPKQEDVWDLNIVDGKPPEKTDYDVSNHWKHISDDYTRLQEKLTRVAIEEGLSNITSTGVHGLESITTATLSADNLGDKQVTDILWHLSFTAKTLLLDCSKEDFWESMVKISPFESFTITNCLDKDKPYSNILLIDAAELQLRLLKRDKLPIFELNELGTTGRHCVHEIKKEGDIYESAVEFIVNVFFEMRKILEKNLTESNYELYLEVYKQTNSLARWKGNKSKSLSNKIKLALGRFAKIKKVERELRKNIIEWPKSVGKISKAKFVS